MAFPLQEIFTPTSIGRIDHFLDDIDGTNPNRSMKFHLEVLNQFGDAMKILQGDETPHLTQTQINNLIAFMTNRRTNLPANLGFAAGNVCGRITWRFRDLNGTIPGKSLHARVVEQTAGGQFVKVYQINDQTNLTQTQINSAIAFLDTQRTKAVNEILG